MRYLFIPVRAAPGVSWPGVVATLWLGLLIGVSFLATPVKFQAPSLDLPTALDVGRVTFALSTKVEWGLWAVLAAATAFGRARPIAWSFVILLGFALAAQSFWLLPVLDERVARIIAGRAVESGPHHLVYIGVEVCKALLLMAATATSLRPVGAWEGSGCG